MKNTLLASLFLGLASPLCAQSLIQKTVDWKVFFEDDKVKFYSKYEDCNLPSEGLFAEYILLKVENKTATPVEVSWYTDNYYPNGCSNCDHDVRDRKRTTQLKPYSSLEGDCSVGLNIGLKVFSKWLRMDNQRTLEYIKVTEIQTQYSK